MSEEQGGGMNKEESVKIFDLVVKQGSLPETIDKLVPLSFIGMAAVKFYQAKVKLMDQLGVTESQRKATLADGQDAGKMLLTIEARIGDLLPSGREDERGLVHDTPRDHGQFANKLPEGINRKHLHHSRTIARHPEAVAQVILEAEDNEDIPTKTAVLNRVRFDAERKRREAAPPPTEIEITSEQMQYITTLERIVNLLPTKPPADWNEKAFQRAQAYVRIIIKRLEVFEDARAHITK